MPTTNLNMVELFAGVGGFRLAGEKAGFSTLFWNQWEPSTKVQHAQKVYLRNFGETGYLQGLSDVDFSTVPDLAKEKGLFLPNGEDRVDLLVGGFPCQDYSVAKTSSSALGIQGKKGVLWWSILEFIRHAKPRFIFLENVDRLLKSPSSQRGRDFAVMLKSLMQAGYTGEWRVVTASDYGSKQRRKRTFIFAEFNGEPHIERAAAGEAIHSSGLMAAAYPVIQGSADVVEIDLQAEILEISNTFGVGLKVSPFKNAGVFGGNLAFTSNVAALKPFFGFLGEILEDAKNVPDGYWIRGEDEPKWKALKSGGSKPRTTRDGFSYNYSEGAMAFPDPLDRPARTILTAEGGAAPSRFKHAIRQDGRLRRLLPIELERLNDFPDGWTAVGVDGDKIPDTRRAFFMGNALVVNVVSRGLVEIAKRLGK